MQSPDFNTYFYLSRLVLAKFADLLGDKQAAKEFRDRAKKTLQAIQTLWDEELGDPAFYGFIVDRTETYEDLNGNGRYDAGVDTFTDSDHEFGGLVFPADGAFQPYYLFFPDGTLGGSIIFDGEFADKNPTDCLNRILSGFLELIGGIK